jgi:hypothetical protein
LLLPPRALLCEGLTRESPDGCLPCPPAVPDNRESGEQWQSNIHLIGLYGAR